MARDLAAIRGRPSDDGPVRGRPRDLARIWNFILELGPSEALLTEAGEDLLTESGETLMTEGS